MKGLIVTPGEKNSARLKELDNPSPSSGEYLIKTLRVGIDATDREINNAEYGKAPEGDDYLVIGHEALGKVIEIGEETRNDEIKLDDLVVPTVRRPDDCHYCQSGEPDMCIKGNYTEHGIKGKHGFLREFFVEQSKYLVKVPPDLEDIAVLLEPLSVVEKGIRQTWKIQERMVWDPKTGLVLGLGSIGILGSLVLKIKGLEVYVYSKEEKSDPRVNLIKKLGIHYISASESELENLNNEIGKNLEFILEATGNSIVAMKAMRLVGQNGVLCLTGVTGGHKSITLCADCLNLDLVLGNKVIFGTVNANIIDFREGLKHMNYLNQKFPGILNKIITHKYRLNEFQEALEDFSGLKAIIEF